MDIERDGCTGCVSVYKSSGEFPCKTCTQNGGAFDNYKSVDSCYDRWTDNKKIHPEHYNNTRISPFDIWDDWNLDPYTATAIKYIKRAGEKVGESAVDDYEKAIDYLKERIKRL